MIFVLATCLMVVLPLVVACGPYNEGSEDLESIRALEDRGVEVTHGPIGSAP